LKLLARGYAAARRFCGWHVTPEREDVLTLDGPGGRLLRLPTLKLTTLTSIVDDDQVYLEEDLRVSGTGMVTKRDGTLWSDKLGAIQVTMSHGFDAAPDFDAAVLSYIDRSSLAPSGGRARVIGPFQYDSDIVDGVFSTVERSLLEQYR